MAKARFDDEHVEKPKPDVYLAIMILTVSAMLIATILMFLEYYSLQ
jgi:hypothetical protein